MKVAWPTGVVASIRPTVWEWAGILIAAVGVVALIVWIGYTDPL